MVDTVENIISYNNSLEQHFVDYQKTYTTVIKICSLV